MNVGESDLFFGDKCKNKHVCKEEKPASGFKAAEDWMALLPGGNATGDLKVKAVYHS